MPPAFEPYGDEVVISTHPWLISSIVNVFRLAEQFDRGASRQCMQSSVTLASAAARLSLPRGTGVGPRENGDLIRPTKASPWGTYFVPSRLRLRELRPEKAVLSARPDAFRAASGLKRVDPRLHSSTPSIL
jgi:hypothetical protein